jgi:cellulose synthase operon protein C
MSQLAATQVSKPRDEQAFERTCVVLWRSILKDPNVQTNASRGQKQDGVDLFGVRNEDTTRSVGIQCKLKGEGKRLTEKEVREEVRKAMNFQPPLREYFIVTTASDEGNLQRVVRELTIEAANTGRSISINVWGWGTLEQRINEHPEAANAFDPTYGPHAKKQADLLMRVTEGQADLTSHFLPLSNKISEVHTTLTSVGFPGDATVGKSALEAAVDAEINGIEMCCRKGARRPR